MVSFVFKKKKDKVTWRRSWLNLQVQTQDEGTHSGKMSVLKYKGDIFT